MKPVINAGMMFDFGKPLPKVDMTPEHYVDYTPDATREAVERLGKLMATLPAPDGQLTGAQVVERMKHLIGGESPGVLVVMDSYSPLSS